jgi:serine/threonine protein kinase
MVWRADSSATSNATGLPAPLDAPVGSHGDIRSIMLATTVTSDENDDLPATQPAASSPAGLSETQPAAPSPADPTRTSEPLSAAQPGPTPAPDPRSLAATQLRDPDRYQIIGEHGRGGLGRVSRAHDRDLGRDVAIKELISRGHVSEVRFLREALITARLEHPGIVPVHEAGRWPDGTPFYAMKLVSGRPLRDLIAERTTVEQRIGLLHHVIAVADAIAYAHGRNIIHRDLKPANVIVGDFGETIVIDWGLAKDLTATEEAATGSPFRTHRDDDLTSAGSVLGTPAYMAPEQERGEHVDQRADVFAIGAMLWELCALQKVPPTDPHQRHRMLRRAGIDQDLATIIDKALAPEPRRRYPDAGALAADLKAFKSGARIAARSYSLLAMLAHWTRRHRRLALSVTAVLAIMVAGSTLSIWNITSERDRADASEDVAKRSQVSAEASLDELTLKHAELLLTTDPSAALDLLAAYHGGNRDRADQIRAEAVGRGSALLRAKPHTDSIRWAAGAPDGSIISLSIDGTITRSSLDQQSTILATGVSPRGRFSYASSRGLLAYGCDPADVCMWDALHGVGIPLSPAFRGWQLAGITFSPNGSKLALLSYSGLIRVFEVSVPVQPVQLLQVSRDQGVGILFVDDDTLAIGLSDRLALELIRMNGETQTLTIHDNFLWEASPTDHRIVLATQQGDGIYLASAPLRVLNRVTLCHDTPTGLKLLPGQRTVAFSCREGAVGTWDLEGHTIAPLTHLEGHADSIAVSQEGDYLIAAGGNGTFVVIDLYTKIITSYRGHNFHLTSISPPTAKYPYLISADVRGALRVWPPPNRIARVSANVHTRFTSAIFNKAANAILATTMRPEITVLSSPNDIRTISPHIGNARYLELAGNGDTFAAYGIGESIEIWSSQPLTRQHVINTGHGGVSRVAFIGETGDFVTAGRDGRLIYWTSGGEQRQATRLNSPITNFVLTHEAKFAVISTADGAIWRADDSGHTLQLRSPGTRVARMLSIPDTASVGIAYANGDVDILDTNSWRKTLVLHATQGIRDIAFTRDGRTIAVADNDDTVHIGHFDGNPWADRSVIWTTFTARASTITLTHDGILVALCSDGTIWLYSSTDKAWMCVPTGTAELNGIAMSTDGKAVVAFDSDGRIVWLDLELARQTFTNKSNNHPGDRIPK